MVYELVVENGREVVRARKVALGGVYNNQAEIVPAGSEVQSGSRIVCDNCRTARRRHVRSRHAGQDQFNVNAGGGQVKTNISQFFVSKRPIAWTFMISVLAWGVYAYFMMPQRQDPIIPVVTGVILTPYPGAEAEKVEQEVTRKIDAGSQRTRPSNM